MRARFGLGEALAFIGAVAMIVSVFLVFVEDVGWTAWTGADFKLMFTNYGMLFFLVALLCFGAFAARSRGILPALAFIGLGFAGLALIGYLAYDFFAEAHGAVGDLREGFYVAGVAALLVFIGGFLKIR